MIKKIAYQDQDCNLTLKEGLEIYYSLLKSASENNNVIKKIEDDPGSSIMRSHDCTHVIFGLDISLEQEAMLDTWTLYGTQFSWSDLLKYSFTNKELLKLYKVFFTEVGIKGFIKLYQNTRIVKKLIKLRAKAMIKKWPYNCNDELLNKRICDLRKDFGIKILEKSERSVQKLNWSGSLSNS